MTPRLDRIAISARVFCLAAILGLSAAIDSAFSTQSVVVVAGIAVTAGLLTAATRLAGSLVAVGEAGLVSLVIGLALPDAVLLIPYLAVPALIAGLYGGARWVAWAVGIEVVALASILSLRPGPFDLPHADLLVSWLFTALGVGLLGSHIRQMSGRTVSVDPLYDDAKALLTELHSVSRRLADGLDPVEIAGRLIELAGEQLDARQAAVFVGGQRGVLTPLRYSTDVARERFAHTDPLLAGARTTRRPQRAVRPSDGAGEQRVAVPLRVGPRTVGVLMFDAPRPPADDALTVLLAATDVHSLRLDTALLFDEIRSIATVEERHRLAREVHDGIAQDVASLGYLVDDLTAGSADAAQTAKLHDLRDELTRVVGELRLSIFDLRSDVTPGSGLGAALSDHVRLVGSRSTMTVHLSLDESPARLRPEVEAELLRIAQEAITNARKHAEADNLWVDCRIRPPAAELRIRDDGRGMGPSADGSFGLRIMRERATRIGADLQIRAGAADGTGTQVTLTLGPADLTPSAPMSPTARTKGLPCPRS